MNALQYLIYGQIWAIMCIFGANQQKLTKLLYNRRLLTFKSVCNEGLFVM